MKKSIVKSTLVRFLIKFLILMLIWEFSYELYLETNSSIDKYLTEAVTDAGVEVMNWFNDVYNTSIRSDDSKLVLREDRAVLIVAHSCNGLILMVLFTVFIVAFEGRWKIKIPTIIIGNIGIIGINIIRVIALIQIALFFPGFLDVSHHYVFTALVYAFVFGMWMIWVNRLSKI